MSSSASVLISDGPVEGLYVARDAGEGGPQPGVEVRPESPGAGDQVLPQTRLGFVDAHRDATGEGRAGVGGLNTLLVESVTGLVPSGEEPDGEQPRVEAGRDPYVTWTAEVDAERVDRPVLAAPAPVVAEAGDNVASEFLLGSLVELAPERRGAVLAETSRTRGTIPDFSAANVPRSRRVLAPGS